MKVLCLSVLLLVLLADRQASGLSLPDQISVKEMSLYSDGVKTDNSFFGDDNKDDVFGFHDEDDSDEMTGTAFTLEAFGTFDDKENRKDASKWKKSL